ncbi:hypothetical protein P3C29_24225 [Pseudomonas sp. 1912-s]|uniref:hypothetical protein n=1 Tax=Pseudomonas sp. 1912-s TaxID=3033802 RepID=UPI0023DF2C6A|nr:hypothetical protein [Pseudomonas sp. 1912-s]MDF3201807.1 hypothetical protein [Pseudomonas sp. 1912-s]
MNNPLIFMPSVQLSEVQRLPTDCARSAKSFIRDDRRYMAIAQFAEDIAGQPAGMHAGDSDICSLIYRYHSTGFELTDSIPVAGAEDAEFFTIGGRWFLATASIRSGNGPFEHDVKSVIFEHQEGRWLPFQAIATFGAKQWHYFQVQGRHFLALAQGIQVPGLSSAHPVTSRIYEWDGQQFVEFQVLEGRWGYGWAHIHHADQDYLAYADHLGPSQVMRWQGDHFAPLFELPGVGGRAFSFFADQERLYLVYASLTGETQLACLAQDQLQFKQVLGGEGGRALAVITHKAQRFLARVCFITGGRENPQPVLTSEVWRWEHEGFVLAATFATFGGTSTHWLVEDDQLLLVVTNSLSARLRFNNDTVIYRLDDLNNATIESSHE